MIEVKYLMEPKPIVPVNVIHKVIGSITELQHILNELCYLGKDRNQLHIDGVIETNTVYAIRQFQIDNNLEVDGIPSFYTWSALRKSIEIKSNPVPIRGIVTKDSINVIQFLCSNPNIIVPVIGTLEKGDIVKIKEKELFKLQGQDWYLIEYCEQGGYVPVNDIELQQ